MLRKQKIISLFAFILLSLSSLQGSGQDTIESSEANKVLSVIENVTGSDNFLDNFAPDSNVVLPFGIRRQIGAVRYIIAIDSCRFKPNGAYFNAYAAIEFPGTTKKMAFEASNIKFNPKGVVGGSQSRLLLVSDHSIKINNLITLKLKGDGSNWIEWDCGGYKAINLTGHFVFNKSELIPDTTQTKDSIVTASFQIYTTDLHEFVTNVSITPFCVKGLKNWSFKTTNAVVDMSELINASGMLFPPGYSNPNMITQEMWTGFYLQSIKIKLPTEISKTGKHTEIIANNLVIDNMGISGIFQINNLLKLDEGSMSGWDYSIDELGVGFVCNKLNSGHLKGRVNIPVMDSTQALSYNANIWHNPTSKEADYSFIISPASNIKFHVFSADVNLDNTSKISVVKANGLFKPTAILNGNMSFNHSKFNSNGGFLQFQNLTFITESPFITQGIFTFNNQGSQIKLVNYPVSLNNVTFGVNAGSPILGFGVNFNILDNVSSSFSAGTTMALQGKIQAIPVSYTDEIPVKYTKTKWKFDKLVVNSISLGVHTAAFAINGIIWFKENDPTYGDGFFGNLQLSIDKVLPAPASVNAGFGSKPTFRYFYVDAAIPTNIPLGSSPITLSKIMGGLYYHMKPLNASQPELITASQTQATNPVKALTYTPDIGSQLGFKAGVGFKFSPSEKTANGDVMIETCFAKSGGLSWVKLDGNVYMLAKAADQVKAPIKGTVAIQYDPHNKIFDANATVTVNAYNSVTGGGSAKIHLEPGIWYACAGKPSTPLKITIENLVDAHAYFMAGNQIEPALTPPNEVTSALNLSGINGVRDETQLSGGAGFCTGASLSSSLNEEFGFDFFTVYGGYNFGLGFDMMMIDYGPNGYCSGNSAKKIGMNGYLANGSMYLYMQGNVGVKGDVHILPGCKCDKKLCLCEHFDFPVFNAGVAALVQGKLPKPLFFSGQFGCYYDILGTVKGNFNFQYKFGTDCTPVKN